MSIEGLLPDAYSTDVCPQVDTGQVGIGIAEAVADEHVSSHHEDQAETMVTTLDAGWTLTAIAAHFGVDVKEVGAGNPEASEFGKKR